jgi:putative ABC transport system permease protein
MISTAVITGSLVAGDSLEHLVYISTFENLGEVDQVIQGSGFFNYDYYSAISEDPSVLTEIDGHAPVILIPVALKSIESGLRDNKAQLFGYDQNINSLGNFENKKNSKTLTNQDLDLDKNEIIINELLADKIKVKENEKVRLIITNPLFRQDSVYSSTSGLNAIERTLTVRYIVEHTGLGRLQLDGRTRDTSNIFMNLKDLQKIMGIGNKINSILVSNSGDKYSGYKNDDKVSKVLTKCLDEEIGYEELGFELNSTGTDYLRLGNNGDIFFEDEIYDKLLEVHNEPDLDFYSSPILTYFVNSIYHNDTNRIINFSVVTGLDFGSDSKFGDFVVEPSESDLGAEVPNSEENQEILDLANDEIVLLDWAAEQLDATVDDKLIMEYMVMDRLFNIDNITHEFTIKYIINLSGKAADKYLMPPFPGLEGEVDCVNWEPPFDINLDRITGPDREFWFEHSGTPKAYISLSQAQELWGTNLGSFSMIKLKSTSSTKNILQLKNEIGNNLNDSLGFSDAELNIIQVKADSLATASGMAILPMMFLAFSSAIIIAGIALIITIFLLIADSRKSDFGIFRAIGSKKGQVIKLYLFEGLIYSIIAGILGVIIGLILGSGLVFALNSIWSSAVQGYDIPVFFKPVSLLIGFVIGFIISLITIYLTARHIANKNITSALYGVSEPLKKTSKVLILGGIFILSLGVICLALGLIPSLSESLTDFQIGKYYYWLFAPFLLLLGIGIFSGYFISDRFRRQRSISIITSIIIIYTILYSILIMPEPNAPIVELFFIIGFVLVLSLILLTSVNLQNLVNIIIRIFSNKNKASPVARYALQNPTRHPVRTGQNITIFTLVIFLLAALSINIAIQQASLGSVTYEERGGYDIIGESAVPIAIDLEDPKQRLENDINDPVVNNVTVTEIKLVGPPGGTCSNMNVRYPPRLLGVGSQFISENKFRFMESLSNTNDHRENWLELEKNIDENNGRIPIAVDYNTLVWIYNSALGDIFEIQDESGSTIKLEVIGILENTVFGGTFIMSQSNLESLYPKSAEYRYILFKLKPGIKASAEHVAADLERALFKYGLDAQPISELILENREYERSFMELFQAFLGLGLILGIVGLGVVTTRTVAERKFEIGVLRTLGFTRKMIMKSFLIELSFITLLALGLGLLVGIISSYLAFGSWTGGIYEFVLPWWDLFLFVIIIYVITVLSALYPAYRASKLPPAEALLRVG